jgi:hypothetical protein
MPIGFIFVLAGEVDLRLNRERLSRRDRGGRRLSLTTTELLREAATASASDASM